MTDNKHRGQHALINIISQIILFPQTVVIEGNYAPGRGPTEDTQ